jgi:ubiquitin carboxyl-terminal hydrolase L5
LSALFNRVPPDQWGPVLHEFNSFTADFPPHLRGVAISGSQEIRVAHNSFRRPDAFLNEEKVVKDEAGGEAFHFVAYLPYKSKVYELDGLQPGPIEIGSARGLAGPGDDSMEEEGRGGGDGGGDQEDEDDDEGWLAVARAAIQDRMDREATEHVKYNLMAVVQDKRVPLQRSLEADPSNEAAAARLADEEAKRERWRLDNQRRRHNFVPLVVEMLKSLAVKDGMLARLAAEGQERAAARKDAAKASQKNK